MLRLLSLVGIAIIGTLIVGYTYEEIGRRRDRARLLQVGTSIDIGGRRSNLFCSGNGQPTVIFDPGNTRAGIAWSHIQPRIAEVTQACWFDRAGEGWSDPGPFPRTSAATARDLHELLTRANVRPPYVLVGHSLGGLDVRVYTGLYPSEVTGAVLVDAAHEDEPRRAPAFMLGRTAPRYLWHPLHILFSATARFGLIRFMTPRVALPTDPTARTQEQIVSALAQQPRAIASYSSGGVVSPESYAQAKASPGFGDRPLIVLTRGKPPDHPPVNEMDRQSAAYEQVWMHEIQPQLARLSTRGRQIIVTTSGHDIPDESPEAIIDAVQSIVVTLRSDTTQARQPR
jgi:pimeloyl-ACP methyl ester carboxylesterase